MMNIGVVIHGPGVIDSGRARSVIDILAGLGEVQPILGGTMGRAAVIDAGLEGLIDISRNLRPSESVRSLCDRCDVVLLVNEGKTRETGLAFGRMVSDKLGPTETPFFQIEFGGQNGILLVPWNNEPHHFLDKLRTIFKARIIEPPAGRPRIEFKGDLICRHVAGVRPGEYVTVNGIVIGKALSDNVCIISKAKELIELRGGRLKPHGVEKLQKVDLDTAVVRSGPLRTADITPRVLEHRSSGYAVIIDHAAEDTFETAKDADVAVVVGDDTTMIAGDLLTRLGIPMIGIVDGDRDGITHHAHVPPGSVVIRVNAGNDDIFGRRIKNGIFGGVEKLRMAGMGFEGLLSDVLDTIGGSVEEVTRY